MQTFDSNQQPAQYRKRKCIVYKPNDFFQAFDFSQHQIISSYETSSESIMIKSLSILIENIRNSSKLKFNEPFSPRKSKKDMKEQLYTFKKNNLTFKKQKNNQEQDHDDSTNPQKQIKEMVQFEKTGQKPPKSTKKLQYCLEEKQEKPNYAKTKRHEKLLNSLERLSVSEQFNDLEQEIQNFQEMENNQEPQNKDLPQFDEDALKNKTISQLLSESNAKIKTNRKKQYSPIQSENSQYQMTDYSSNESSNEDGDYQEKLVFQNDNTPLFGTIFAHGIYKPISSNIFGYKPNFSNDSVQHPPKLNFKSLMDSPKKQKTNRKRVYINRKKVPRWAENRQQIAKQFGCEYQRNLRKNANEIFGICIVEDMQTNTIFDRKDEYKRSSTVKWQRQKRYVV